MTRIRVTRRPDVIGVRAAMDRLIEDSVVLATADGSRSGVYVPLADAWEDDDQVVIELAVAAADVESVNVTYENESLTVKGEVPPRDEERTWVLLERPRGAFERRFNMAVPVDPTGATARYEAGVLRLTLPKREEVKPRRIEVTSD